jgi:peroxiredoxin
MGTSIGSYAPDFELPGIDDEVHHLARYLETCRAVATVFMCNQCQHVRSYLDRLKQIQSEFESQNVTLIGINPNDSIQDPEESFENMRAFASHHQLNFPYLRDVTQDVARGFGVEKLPQVFLLDRAGIVCYIGQIDDNADDIEGVRVPYLRQAIAQLLDGKTIHPDSTEPVGCQVKWR